MTKERKVYLDELFGSRLQDAVKRFRSEFFESRWDQYMRLVQKAEDHPTNQSGADKTWVEQVLETNRRHYRSAVRVR